MANQTGIAIAIKAFLPTGKTLNEQFEALSIVKTAHETGDYSALLKAATVEEVKTEQKTRRIEDVAQVHADLAQNSEWVKDQPASEDQGGAVEAENKPEAEAKPAADADVPEFLKKEKKAKAA